MRPTRIAFRSAVVNSRVLLRGDSPDLSSRFTERCYRNHSRFLFEECRGCVDPRICRSLTLHRNSTAAVAASIVDFFLEHAPSSEVLRFLARNLA
jgi:hypothetical protein